MIRENTIFYPDQAKSTDVLMSHMGKGHKLLSEKSMNKNSLHNWSEYLERISKNKDAIAFRHLFEHFAPRVKSFLMKSGFRTAKGCSSKSARKILQGIVNVSPCLYSFLGKKFFVDLVNDFVINSGVSHSYVV